MKKRHIALSIVALAGIGIGAGAFIASPTIHEGTPGEAPELGHFGEYQVGTTELAYALGENVTFGKIGMATGGVETAPRELMVRLYYPAQVESGGDPIRYTQTMDPPDMEAITLDYQGRAFADAGPVTDSIFPLVLMSHGFNGWSTQYSNLAEHIASRGYVVASIDHADLKLEGVTDFVHSFSQVLSRRSLDQRQVLAKILEQNANDDGGIFSLIDTENVGLIGYSMGGFGALASVGADYDYGSETFGTVPSDAMAPVRAAAQDAAPIDALITFAPWGGQPDNRVWSADTLGQVNVPVMMVAGSEDDVSNYREGIRWIFDQLTGANRYMLVYREARHNIVGNAFDMPEGTPFRAIEFVNEPVWRQDRINSINQHFVAAFLDLTLKGEADKAGYLDVPQSDSNAGQWDIAFGEQLNGTYADEEETDHWRGFQRRWALGLEMLSKQAGE
ncbi:MAG: hypothetical protein ABJP48_09790 [Erythrobacter sp.]